MDNETEILDVIKSALKSMTLAQADELAKVKRQGMELSMNSSMAQQLDHDIATYDIFDAIAAEALAYISNRKGK